MTGKTKTPDRTDRKSHPLDGLFQDVRFALRTFRKSPGFTVVAILTLALGIGATTAIFTLVNGVILRPLPFEDPDQLVRVLESRDRGAVMAVAWPNFEDWYRESRTLESLAAYAGGPGPILGGEHPVQTTSTRVTRDFFRVLRVSPARGRGLSPEDHREGAAPAAVVSHRFWQNELGAPSDLNGVTLESGPFTFEVVGVMPHGFDFPTGTDLWYPVELQIWGKDYRSSHNYFGIGRLADGVPATAAQDELSTIVARANQGEESPYLATGASVQPLQTVITGRAREPLLLLLGAAALVLLVACSNLASTFLARAKNREREIAVRASLGAGRGRLVRQFLTEALSLSVVGAAAGLLLAWGVVRSVSTLAPAGTIPRLDGIRLDPWVLGFTGAVTVLTAVLFGLLPALQASGSEVGEALRAGHRGFTGGRGDGTWRFLVAGEVALALMLLVGSGLLLRSFNQVLSLDPGFDTRGVIAADLKLPATRFSDDPAKAGYFQELLGELEAIPGVRDAGIADNLPLASGIANGRIDVEGGPEPFADGRYQSVSAGYFRVMEIPLLRGRLFDDRDHAGAEHVAVVDQGFAERAWPGENPIGKRISGGGMDRYLDPDSAGPPANPELRWARVVGVVGNVRHRSLTEDPVPTYYFHYLQRPQRMLAAHAVVEAAGDPRKLATPIREAAQRVSGDVPVDVRPMEQVALSSVGRRRFIMLVLGAFALSSLLLAAAGIYGVVSYSVARRTREMGIRLALGARPAEVRSLVQRGAMVTVLLGTGAGVLGGLAATRLLQSFLYGVAATDPLTFGAVGVILTATAWIASWIPALRSTRIDPMLTMKAE